MKRTIGTAGAAVAALLLGTALPVLSGAEAAAAPVPVAGTLYVQSGPGCSNSGSGTQTLPYCTISAAAAVVQAGQTVMVAQGTYNESVDITRSGTANAPITFVGASNLGGPAAHVGLTATGAKGPAFSVSGAQNVVIKNFISTGSEAQPAVLVNNSSNITVNQGYIYSVYAPGVQVTGSSSNVTLSRLLLQGDAEGGGVEIDPGVTGAVVTTNIIDSTGNSSPGVLVNGSPGAVVTSNSLFSECGSGISLEGASPGSTIENNVVQASSAGSCPATDNATALAVSADSTAQTTVDYNLVAPVAGQALYSWGGTGYADSTDFAADSGSGQGAQDITASPQITLKDWISTVGATSPAINSADSGAPGELPTDFYGNPRMDDPAVTATGAGSLDYFDRGAVELQGGYSGGGTVSLASAGAADPLTVTATATDPTTSWVSNGPITPTYLYTFQDPSHPVSTTATSVDFTYWSAGTYSVGLGQEYGNLSIESQAWATVGDDYTPVTPTRLLDTRSAIGVKTTTPVAAGQNLVLPIPSIAGFPDADVNAIVANVTVTDPTATGFLTVSPEGEALPTSSNLNFTKGDTVPNLVTVPMGPGGLVFHNGSSGTVHIIADLQGFYGSAGYGYKPLTASPVLDTRSGLGAATAKPVAARGTLGLNLSGQLPQGATAAVLNVTVTQPKATGFLTVYPDGAATPTASDLNFTTGQTVANLVVVPVTDGKVDLYNGSGGTVALVADLEGYFGNAASGAVDTYVPITPTRIMDTRTSEVYRTVPAWSYIVVLAAPTPTWGKTITPVALVANMTVTQPQASGSLTAFAVDTDLPQSPTTSNLNFSKGETVPNLVSTPVTDNGFEVYNNSAGTSQIIVDEEGYYIQP